MKLSLSGLKAKPRTLDLDRLNLVLAPNGAGKTSIPTALKVLLLGYDPLLGKRPSDTAALMSDGRLDLSLTLDDGRTLQRQFRRRGKSIERSSEASWVRQGVPSDHEEAILALAGKEAREAEENLTIRSLLDAPPSQKAQVIEGILSAGKKTPAEIAEATANLTVMHLRKIDPEKAPKSYNRKADVENLDDAVKVALKAAGAMLEAKIKSSGIPGAITWANESKNAAAKSVKDKTAAKGELETRLGECPEAPQAEIDRLEEEKAKVQKELGAAEERGAQAERQRDSFARAMTEKKLAEDDVMAAQFFLHAHEAKINEIPGLRAKHEALAKEVIKMQVPKREPCEEADRLLEQAQAKLDTLDELREEPRPDFRVEGLEVDRLKDALDELEASPWPEVKKIGQALKRNSDDAISAKGERLVEIARAHLDVEDDPEILQEKLARAEQAKQAAVARLEAVVERNKDIIAKREQIRREADVLHEQAVQARNRHEASYNERASAWTDSIRAKADERDDLLNAIRKAEQAQAEATTRLETAKARHEAAAKRVKELEGEAGGAPQTVLDIDALVCRNIEIAKQLTALHRAAAARSELSGIIAEIDKAQAERSVYAAIEWALARVRETEIGDASAPLLGRIQKFLSASGRVETPYLRASRTDVEIGWTDSEGREVAVQVMSGAEYALFSTALAAAVIAIRKPPLKVLIVEAGEVSEPNLEPLMKGVMAVQDEIDIALIMYPHEIRKTLPVGFKTTRLE